MKNRPLRVRTARLNADLPFLAATAVIAIVAALLLALAAPATVNVDGQRIASDVGPVTVGSRVFLPVRAVSEAAGGAASYDAKSGRITIERGTDRLVMTVGKRNARLNGHGIELTEAPFTVHGRALVRSTDVAIALGSSVHYDRTRGRVSVRTPGAVVAGAPDDEAP